jgi:uncharacterized protein YbjT (DUF2867 family)
MGHLVTVTGATGNTGRAIAERLLALGINVRAIAQDAGKLATLAAQGAEIYEGDLADTNFLKEPFRGADAVFAMIPQRFGVADYPADQRRLVRSVTDALERAEVRHVVALSTPGARLRVGLPGILADFEDRLRSIPALSVVVLLPMYFMENHLASIPMITNAGITGGAVRADVPLPMVSTRDVAAAAVDYLTDPTFEGYSERLLLGPRDYTFREVSSILAASIGMEDLPYVELSYDDFRNGLMEAGVSASAADAFVEMVMTINDGRLLAGIRRDTASTTPTTLEAFASEVFSPAYQRAGAGLNG